MPTAHTLPDNPDLGHLRRQARALQQSVRAGDPDATARVLRQHPDGVPEDPTQFRISSAQLVIAREYGFPSWPRLRRYLDLVTRHGWDITPARSAAGQPADEFCRLACLTYSDADGPDRWAQARRLLAERPGLTEAHIWAAATAADSATVERLLAADPSLARRAGGPYGWTPLCYVAYSRLDLAVPAEPVLAIARRLLDAGADPDEGYLWNGRPYPFTLLTGAFGEGELGPARQPRHPHSGALGRLLLDAGANPNDSQALYNRQFRPDNDHLELLLAYGLGTGASYPWRDRLGDLLGRPAELLRDQLRWAVEHDFGQRVRLLVRHGVDVNTRYGPDGPTAVELAALNGNPEIVEYLVAEGASPPELDPVRAFVAAALAGDRAAIDRLRTAYPDVVKAARRARPGLPVWAAANRRRETVAVLAELGFDINAFGRGDSPIEQPWETALHHAASQGDLDLVGQLLAVGADPHLTDRRFGATPLGWARHFGQESVVALLAPVTEE